MKKQTKTITYQSLPPWQQMILDFRNMLLQLGNILSNSLIYSSIYFLSFGPLPATIFLSPFISILSSPLAAIPVHLSSHAFKCSLPLPPFLFTFFTYFQMFLFYYPFHTRNFLFVHD